MFSLFGTAKGKSSTGTSGGPVAASEHFEAKLEACKGAVAVSKPGAEAERPVKPALHGPDGDKPPPEGQRSAEYPQLDLVFMCDCTGSMGSYIHAAQQNIRSIVERVVSSEKAEVRFALVAYRDHPPQDETYVTWVHPFTSDVNVMKGYVDTMEASGGGDGPEAVTAALHDALHLPWRAAATKIAVLIADAPPHGLEPCGDGFPNGDPLGRDPLAVAREMAKQEITCYTVGCEPALGGFRFARDFMCTLAEITGGQAVALASAALLADVIVNGSAEEISLMLLQREVEQELDHVRQVAEEAGESLEEDVVYQRAAGNLHSRNVRCKQMQTDGAMKNAHYSIWHKSEMQTLSACKEELCAAEYNMADFECSRSRMRSAPTMSARKKNSGPLGAVAAMFRRGSRRSESVAEKDECVGLPSYGAEVEVCDGLAEEIDPVASSLSAHRGRRCEASGVSAAAPVAMSKNVLTEDLISVDQVSRMAKRSACRKSGR